jgi:hypothetical protein
MRAVVECGFFLKPEQRKSQEQEPRRSAESRNISAIATACAEVAHGTERKTKSSPKGLPCRSNLKAGNHCSCSRSAAGYATRPPAGSPGSSLALVSSPDSSVTAVASSMVDSRRGAFTGNWQTSDIALGHNAVSLVFAFFNVAKASENAAASYGNAPQSKAQ